MSERKKINFAIKTNDLNDKHRQNTLSFIVYKAWKKSHFSSFTSCLWMIYVCRFIFYSLLIQWNDKWFLSNCWCFLLILMFLLFLSSFPRLVARISVQLIGHITTQCICNAPVLEFSRKGKTKINVIFRISMCSIYFHVIIKYL